MTTIVKSFWSLLAEREGFEPPVPLGTTVFKTVVIDHSTISPEGNYCSPPASLLKASAKVYIISETAKYKIKEIENKTLFNQNKRSNIKLALILFWLANEIK